MINVEYDEISKKNAFITEQQNCEFMKVMTYIIAGTLSRVVNLFYIFTGGKIVRILTCMKNILKKKCWRQKQIFLDIKSFSALRI